MAETSIAIRIDPTGAETGGRVVKKSFDDIKVAAKGSEDAVNRARDGLGRFVRAGAGAAVANDNMARSASRLSAAYGRVQASVLGAARSFAAMAAASFGAVAVVRTIAGFEESMAAVSAITRATGEELKGLRDIAKELGASTEFSASQAADGLKFLGMAGFSAAQSIQAIPAVLDLATAAQMDLARAADISSNIMSAFGISADKAASVADVLAAAASRANTDVSQLGDAMKYVGPIASAMGISMSDSAAAVGTLSDAGLQGSMAGTGLRQVLSSLANATPAATKALRGMGLTMADLNPATNSLVTIVERLAAAGLDAGTALEVFGDRGAPAILNLVAGLPKLRQLTATLGDVEGEAKRMADTMRDSLGGDLKNLMSAIEGLIISIGEAGLTTVLRATTQAITALVRGVASLVDSLNLIAPYAGIAAAGLALIYAPAIITGLTTVTGLIIGMGVASLRTAAAFTVAWLAALGPAGWFVAGLTAAAAAAYYFRDSIREAFGIDVVGIAIGAANTVINSFEAAFEDVKFIWEQFPDIFRAAVIGAVNAMIRGVNAMVQAAVDGIDWLIDKMNAIPGIDIGKIGPVAPPLKEMQNPAAGRLAAANVLHRMRIEEILAQTRIGGQGAADAFRTAEQAAEDLKTAVEGVGRAAAGLTPEMEKAFTSALNAGRDEIERLQLEIGLVGASADERIRLTAALEAEQVIRRIGLDVASKEAAQLREQAGLIAELTIQLRSKKSALDEVKDAWADVQSVGMKAIDALGDKVFDGIKGIKDFVNGFADDIRKSLMALAVQNPLKNWAYGTNLPTLDTIGGVKGFFSALLGGAAPGTQSVASMDVQAAVVNINGAGLGDTVSRLLNPANSNLPGQVTRAPLGGISGAAPGSFRAAQEAGLGMVANTVAGGGVRGQVWNFFAQKGLAPHQIAGIMGNIHAESAFNPLAVGDSGNAFGLFQWNDRRHSLFNSIGGKQNLGDVQKQLDFAWKELQTTESRAFQNLLAAKDVRGATAAFGGFERPQGFSWANPEGMHNWTGRLAAAEQAMQDFATRTTQTAVNLGDLGANALDATGGLGDLANNLTGLLGNAGGAQGGGLLGWLAKLFGFEKGGFTGYGPSNQPAGVVHAGEYVVRASEVSKPGVRPLLEAINAGSMPAGFSKGGYVEKSNTYVPPRAYRAEERGVQASQPVIVKQELKVVDRAGVTFREEEEDDGAGGKRPVLIVEERMAAGVTRRGSAMRGALESEYGLRPRRRKFG